MKSRGLSCPVVGLSIKIDMDLDGTLKKPTLEVGRSMYPRFGDMVECKEYRHALDAQAMHCMYVM